MTNFFFKMELRGNWDKYTHLYTFSSFFSAVSLLAKKKYPVIAFSNFIFKFK